MMRTLLLLSIFTVILCSCSKEDEDFTQSRIDALFAYIDDDHFVDTLYSPLTKNDEGEEVSVIIGLRMKNKEGIQDGPTLVIDTKGMIREEKHFRNGVNHGVMRRYLPTGVLDQEIHFSNGLLDSMGTKNYESGALQSKLMLFNNRPGGNSIEYYENGNPKLYSFVLPSGQQAYRIEYNEQGRIALQEGKLMQMFLYVGEDTVATKEPVDLTVIVTDLPHLPVSEAEAGYSLSKQEGEEWIEVKQMDTEFVMGWDRVNVSFDEPGNYRFESVVDFRRGSNSGTRDSVLVNSISFFVE